MDKIHMLYGCIISMNEKDKRYVYTVKYNETKLNMKMNYIEYKDCIYQEENNNMI